jgi:hypothetical protein
MKIDTMLKLGSLAFGGAQDEKVRELLNPAHNGAKRRGFMVHPACRLRTVLDLMQERHTGPDILVVFSSASIRS